ncbi:hypothetical protein F0L68_03440 [Solihabitans fulvus]|uniref:DUF4129 domain-containing protein n=1 Tax=Solihabitans fulvus TaxID=1892852 RepID=A0A5B2XTF0_9PSEU|nr:AMED_5909 family protein [Solihabitans fulvus]KAA2266200.1 hypothetical protein F0L68_03440 [Solihabitans fulvus]
MTRAGDPWAVARQARTLNEAHDAVGRLRPPPSGEMPVWLEFYRRSAAVYAEVAETDRGHHHEALYWAGREARMAEEIDSRIRSGARAD